MDGIEGSALAGAIDAVLVTQQNADRAGIAGPTQGWGPWAAALSAAAQGQMEAAPASDSIGMHYNLHGTVTAPVSQNYGTQVGWLRGQLQVSFHAQLITI